MSVTGGAQHPRPHPRAAKGHRFQLPGDLADGLGMFMPMQAACVRGLTSVLVYLAQSDYFPPANQGDLETNLGESLHCNASSTYGTLFFLC